MTIAESTLPEFDHQMGSTRKVLERVSPDKFAWKPHDKSMSLGRLATHVAELLTWAEALVFLRLTGAQVPAVYGPSADEMG